MAVHRMVIDHEPFCSSMVWIVKYMKLLIISIISGYDAIFAAQ